MFKKFIVLIALLSFVGCANVERSETVGAQFHTYTPKAAPTTADIALVSDQADANAIKTITLNNLPVSAATQTALDGKVGTTGDETIAGVKTHTSFPVTPSSEPTTTYQVANKKYAETVSELGIHLRTFMKKARDWRSSKPYAQAPKIVLIGDSIASGSWAEDFKSWLCTEYKIPAVNFEIHWYGGYSAGMMIPFIEDIAIFPNPDLIIFGEYDPPTDYRWATIENCIKMFKERTSADVAIYTESMTDTIAQAYIDDSTTLKDDSEYQDFNWYRDIAAKYNCELIDTNEAIKIAIDNGATVTSLGMSGPHLSEAGYTAVFLPEFKRHFKLSDNQNSLNLSTVENKEELIYLNTVESMDIFSESENITATGAWSAVDDELRSSTTGDTIEINMKNIIGFEIIHGDNAGASLSLKEAGGSYANPSTFTYNNRVLQYVTKIVPESFGIDGSFGNNMQNLPFQKGVITANELADQCLISGRYTIKVNSIVGETVTCEMFCPDSTSLGTFVVGQAATFVTGNLSFPQKYNGQDNFLNSTSYGFVVDEIFEFYVKNNWCNTLLAAATPEIIHGVPPYHFENYNENNYIDFDNVTGEMHYVYDGGADFPTITWYDTTMIQEGTLCEYTYLELNKTGSHIRLDNAILNTGTVRAGTFTASGTPLTIRRAASSVTDVTYKMFLKGIDGNYEYADTKKVFGLERGDYTLRLTVTTGVDLIGIRLLHGDGTTSTSSTVGDQLGDVVATAPILVNGVANVDDALPGSDADITFSMPAATNSTPGHMTAAQVTSLESTLVVAGTPAVGDIIIRNAANDGLEYKTDSRIIRVFANISNNGSVITTGVCYKHAFILPYACTLEAISLITHETAGSCTIDVWAGTLSGTTGWLGTTDADSLFDTATELTMTNAGTDANVYTTTFDTGEEIMAADKAIIINVDACATLTSFCVMFKFIKD